MKEDEKRVYFLRPVGERGPIKIGCSVKHFLRAVTLERASPVKLEIIVSTKGSHNYESRLYRHFKTTRRHGEWFEYSDELWSLIEHIRKHDDIEASIQLLHGEAEREAARWLVVAAAAQKRRAHDAEMTEIRMKSIAFGERLDELMAQGKTNLDIAEIMGIGAIAARNRMRSRLAIKELDRMKLDPDKQVVVDALAESMGVPRATEGAA